MGYTIITRYHGPTNYRGSRVIGTGPALHLPAWDAAPGTRERLTRATVSWDYGAGNGDGCTVCGEAPNDTPASMAGTMHRYGPRADHDYTAGTPNPYGGWGDSDANHRRAADAVVRKLRADGWTVSLDAGDRGASLPDDSGRVFVLRYRSDGEA
jgi:hypothetical protein